MSTRGGDVTAKLERAHCHADDTMEPRHLIFGTPRNCKTGISTISGSLHHHARLRILCSKQNGTAQRDLWATPSPRSTTGKRGGGGEMPEPYMTRLGALGIPGDEWKQTSHGRSERQRVTEKVRLRRWKMLDGSIVPRPGGESTIRLESRRAKASASTVKSGDSQVIRWLGATTRNADRRKPLHGGHHRVPIAPSLRGSVLETPTYRFGRAPRSKGRSRRPRVESLARV